MVRLLIICNIVLDPTDNKFFPMWQADTLAVKNSIGSAVDAMQSVSRSICMMLSKVRKGNAGNFVLNAKRKKNQLLNKICILCGFRIMDKKLKKFQVQETKLLVSELADVVVRERDFMQQCRELLSTIAALQVS